MPERLPSLLYVSAGFSLHPFLPKWKVDTEIIARLCSSPLADGPGSPSHAGALATSHFLSQQAVAGFVMIVWDYA